MTSEKNYLKEMEAAEEKYNNPNGWVGEMSYTPFKAGANWCLESSIVKTLAQHAARFAKSDHARGCGIVEYSHCSCEVEELDRAVQAYTETIKKMGKE